MELSTREDWRIIRPYSNYEVSDIGRVRNAKTGRILKPLTHGHGYYYVGLSTQNKVKKHLVHRLVAEEFITNEDGKANVDHRDGNKANNCVSNLWWVSKSDCNMNQKPQQMHMP